MSRVAIIIPTWNGLRYLPGCLNAALRQTYGQYEVVLVDNGSCDGTQEFVTTHYSQVRVLRSERNLGFAAGTNFGIRNTRSDYVATLNNDTEVEPGWLEELVKVMDSDPKVGMCASKMLFSDQPQVINSAGIAIDRIGIAWDRDGGKRDEDTNSEPYYVLGPCAGAALYRRAMLDEVGLFDEDFWAYLEDADLAWRAQAYGWRCRYVPAARVYHLYSATGRKDSSFKDYLLARNRVWMILKNYPWPYWLAYSPLIFAYDLVATAYRIATTRRLHSLYGRLAALRSFPVALQKRRAIQSHARYSARLAFACLSPLDSPMQIWKRFQYLRTIAPVEGR